MSLVKQSDAVSENHGNNGQYDFVNETSMEKLLRHVGTAFNPHVFARSLSGLLQYLGNVVREKGHIFALQSSLRWTMR